MDRALFQRPAEDEGPRRQRAFERLLLPGPDGVAERLAAAETQLAEQSLELARLREEVEALRRALPPEAPASGRGGGRLVELPGPEPPGPAYWLSRCAGFRVDTATGRLGTVAEVRFGSRHDRPDVLVVHVRRQRRPVLVPVEEVEEIAPAERRIRLKPGPRERRLPDQSLLSRLTHPIRAA